MKCSIGTQHCVSVLARNAPKMQFVYWWLEKELTAKANRGEFSPGPRRKKKGNWHTRKLARRAVQKRTFVTRGSAKKVALLSPVLIGTLAAVGPRKKQRPSAERRPHPQRAAQSERAGHIDQQTEIVSISRGEKHQNITRQARSTASVAGCSWCGCCDRRHTLRQRSTAWRECVFLPKSATLFGRENSRTRQLLLHILLPKKRALI